MLPVSPAHPPQPGTDLAGCTPVFPPLPGATLQTSHKLASLQTRQLLFNRLGQPGQVQIYSAECRAGERLRAQLLVPVLPAGSALAAAFAIVAQSLPYSADVHKLPFALPAGYSAVVATPPTQLAAPIQDPLTQVRYYLGPLIDTRTLVGGRVYLVVWSPHNHMGKYAVKLGHRWPLHWTYWAQLPLYLWQIRGWFGLSRVALLAALATLLGLAAAGAGFLRRRR
jgi:hypothetical protein